ncbi:MAG: hypothetical protein WBG41_12140 [Acidimicrobiales bacterium]
MGQVIEQRSDRALERIELASQARKSFTVELCIACSRSRSGFRRAKSEHEHRQAVDCHSRTLGYQRRPRPKVDRAQDRAVDGLDVTVTGEVQVVNVPFGGGNSGVVRIFPSNVVLAIPLLAVVAV